jgi:hypothetical protein
MPSTPPAVVETVGIQSPGDMGSGVGRALGARGLRVLCALGGRSERSRGLAAAAELEDVGDLETLAALLLARGRLAEAERLSRLALATLRRQLGPRHPTTAICLKNYAAILKRIGHPRKAARLGQRAAHILNAIDAVNDEGIAVTATINPLRTRYRLMVRTSPVHRFGVYTKEPIPAGHRVIEYTGEKIARAEAKRRWDPVRSYLFELDSYWRLDGAVGGSGAEYINHSCVPNLVTRQRGHRIFYFSKRRIATGEELTVDYKYAADLPPMACRCLAPDCRGTMNRLNLPRPKSLTATGRVSDTG